MIQFLFHYDVAKYFCRFFGDPRQPVIMTYNILSISVIILHCLCDVIQKPMTPINVFLSIFQYYYVTCNRGSTLSKSYTLLNGYGNQLE